VEVDRLSNERRKADRRTGAIFLVLIAATDAVVWMEPMARARVAGEPAAVTEIRAALASCFFAATLILMAWVFGRRSTSTDRFRTARFRLLGLQLSLLAAVLNLALASAYRFVHLPHKMAVSELLLLSLLWYLISLPLQFAAGYAMGRGSRSVGRRGTAQPPAAARASGL
jgi:hypothetical protein